MGHAEPYLQTYWDWRAAGNFILGGTGAGLMVAAPLAALAGGQPALFVLAALVSIGAGLGLVWLEIGKRLRAMNVFRHPHMSWMTRESYAAVATFLIALAAVWWNGLALAVLAALAALTFLYCQGRILLASKGIPVWREKRLLPLIVATGVAEGAAAALLLAWLFATIDAIPDQALPQIDQVVVPLAAAVLVLLRAVAWHRYFQRIQRAAPDKAVLVLRRFQRGFISLGHILPILILIVGTAWGTAVDWLAAIAAASILLSGWWLKFTLVTRAAYTQGFAIANRPARGPTGTGGVGVKPGWSADQSGR